MADSHFEERSEAPTPRRIRQARRDGNVVFSRELSAAVALAVACIVFVAAAPSGLAGLAFLMRKTMQHAVSGSSLASATKDGLLAAGLTMALPLGMLWGVAGVVGLAQTRGFVSILLLRPEARRFAPTFARILGRDRVVETGKGILCLCVLFSVAWWSIRPVLAVMAGLAGAGSGRILHAIGVLGGRLSSHLALAMLALGAADYGWQYYRHGKALLMSREEVKRDHKESEGDPSHKAERFRIHQEFMSEPSLAEVTRADFVVLHAGAVAAAVRYERASSSAPIVILRGEFGRARAIAAGARLSNVPILVDPKLARALAMVDEGSEIPEDLYELVADCLVRVKATAQGGP